MGTNLFVEGYPAPVLIDIRLPGSRSDFRSLREVAAGFEEVDAIFRKEWCAAWPSLGQSRRKRDVYLVSFALHSPPELRVFADPAWLAVFIAVLCGYKDLKGSLNEMMSDARRLFTTIEGLTDRQLELLNIAVRLTFERWTDLKERHKAQLVRRMQRARRRLLRERLKDTDEELPTIHVTDIDGRNRPW